MILSVSLSFEYLRIKNFLYLFLLALANPEKSNSKTEEEMVNMYMEPLLLACDSRQPRLTEIGLDGMHYLIGE